MIRGTSGSRFKKAPAKQLLDEKEHVLKGKILALVITIIAETVDQDI